MLMLLPVVPWKIMKDFKYYKRLIFNELKKPNKVDKGYLNEFGSLWMVGNSQPVDIPLDIFHELVKLKFVIPINIHGSTFYILPKYEDQYNRGGHEKTYIQKQKESVQAKNRKHIPGNKKVSENNIKWKVGTKGIFNKRKRFVSSNKVENNQNKTRTHKKIVKRRFDS